MTQQIKTWEQSIDNLIKTLIEKNVDILKDKWDHKENIKDDVVGELERLSHEMMSVSL